ncbi:uncharacterized protein LAESUDRAFT_754740 [Laetiporus sulphureus 93-53]|uniref:Uncharacterized protein n=1 Tax=Laetiporus sulphureus 93-53 TaxID=1314785 RepID=A0A165HVQ3_9APHY|nr:uncharacterized protein LAESUDRAFT_754740 [Laetiporus sulphureus 93-53]KZT12254.1 hypothetical protein LAESUDRAFT_754740 [Laetiporus sulphureus 93-53]
MPSGHGWHLSGLDHETGRYISTVPDVLDHLQQLSSNISALLNVLSRKRTTTDPNTRLAHTRIISVSRTLLRVSGVSTALLQTLLLHAKDDVDDNKLCHNLDAIAHELLDAVAAVDEMEKDAVNVGYKFIPENFLTGPQAFYIPLEDTCGINAALFCKRTRDALMNPSFFASIHTYDNPEPRRMMTATISPSPAFSPGNQQKRRHQYSVATVKMDSGIMELLDRKTWEQSVRDRVARLQEVYGLLDYVSDLDEV